MCVWMRLLNVWAHSSQPQEYGGSDFLITNYIDCDWVVACRIYVAVKAPFQRLHNPVSTEWRAIEKDHMPVWFYEIIGWLLASCMFINILNVIIGANPLINLIDYSIMSIAKIYIVRFNLQNKFLESFNVTEQQTSKQILPTTVLCQQCNGVVQPMLCYIIIQKYRAN